MIDEKNLPEVDKNGIVKSGAPQDIKKRYNAMIRREKENEENEKEEKNKDNGTEEDWPEAYLNQIKAFRDICYKIFEDHSKKSKANASGKKHGLTAATIGKIYNYHGIFPVFILNGGERYSDIGNFKGNISRNAANWISGSVEAPIFSDRTKLIDFLLYFNYKKYDLPSYRDRMLAFNNDLQSLGYDATLGLFDDFQEFSVRAAMMLGKKGKDLYKLFRRIYFNKELRGLLKEGKGYTNYLSSHDHTNHAVSEFAEITTFLELKSFVVKYKEEFGRPRLRSYHAFCLLVLGTPLENIIQTIKKESTWTADAMYKTETEVKQELSAISHSVSTSEEINLRYLFHTYCSATFKTFKKVYKDQLIAKRKADFEREKNLEPEKSVFDMHVTQEECREFLRLKHNELLKIKRGISVTKIFKNGRGDLSTRPSEISISWKGDWEHEATEFYIVADGQKSVAKRKAKVDLAKRADTQASIFDLRFAEDDCREFLRMKHYELLNYSSDIEEDIAVTKAFQNGWNDMSTNPAGIPTRCKDNWEQAATEFFFAEKAEGEGTKVQNTWIEPPKQEDELPDKDAVLESFFSRDQSVTKEALLVAIALCLPAESFDRNWENWRANIDTPEIIATRIRRSVDSMLDSIGMTRINAKVFPFDFLFLNTLYHMDYQKIDDACREGKPCYPIREYIFGEILHQESYMSQERLLANMIKAISSAQNQEQVKDDYVELAPHI